MTRLKILLVFISLFALRWASLVSPLPSTWTPDSVVRFTAPILDQPEHTDINTIIRSGVWYISLWGYAEIIPGSRVSFTGKVTPSLLMGKPARIVMTDPTFEVVRADNNPPLHIWERGIIWLGSWREKWVTILEKTLPEPMSSLAAGILLGVKRSMPTDFYQNLVNTGTLHIIAASGYNVTIVAAVIMKIALMIASRGVAIFLGMVGVLTYIIMAGAGASVVRAGIMGGLTLISYYWGRPAEAKRLLWVTGGAMLLINPLRLIDVGFQLSFMATAGILYLEPWIKRVGLKVSFLADYLYPTLAATVATLPVIWWHFGRVSWISPLVNMLVLPLVPLIMGMTAGVIGVGLVLPGLGQVMAWFTYVPLAAVVFIIRIFGS